MKELFKITEFGAKCIGNKFYQDYPLGTIKGIEKKYLASHKENAEKRGNEIVIEKIK